MSVCDGLLHGRNVGEAGALFGQRRQAFHAADLVDSENTAADEDLLDLRLLQFVRRIDVGEDELQVIPAEALADGVAGEVLGDEAGDGDDGGAEGVVILCGSGVAIDVALQAEQHGRQIEGVGDHTDEEFLPLQAEVGVSAAVEVQNFRLGFDREDGDFAGAFDFVLPPADEALVLLRSEVLQPERVLHDAVAAKREAKRWAQRNS